MSKTNDESLQIFKPEIWNAKKKKKWHFSKINLADFLKIRIWKETNATAP